MKKRFGVKLTPKQQLRFEEWYAAYVAAGSFKLIAHELGITVSTARNMAQNIRDHGSIEGDRPYRHSFVTDIIDMCKGL